MTTNKLWVVALATGAFSLCTTLGLAQPTTRLSEAQKAYAAVDYEATRNLARAALEAGGNDRATTSELYLLWATAAAALDQRDEARTAFSFALAANLAIKLDRNLSPKIRGPYQEARGSATSADGRSPLGVSLTRRGQGLELVLRDRLRVARHLVVATREQLQQTFEHRRFEAAPSRRLPLPGAVEIQFYVQVLDQHDNVLYELGSAEEPRRMATSQTPPVPGSQPALEAGAGRAPYYITAASLAALGLASGGVATAMFLRREAAADEWNGPGCEHPGATRQQQCGAVDERRQNAEYLTVGFAAAGGALLIGSVLSLWLAPSAPRAAVGLDAASDRVMLRLRTTL